MLMKLSMTGAAFLLVSGCAMEREWQEPIGPTTTGGRYVPPVDDDDTEECFDCQVLEPTIAIESGHVGGHIGVFRDLDLTVDTPSVYEDPSWNYTNINLTGYRDDGDMGMIFMDLLNVTVGELPEGSSECNYDGGTGPQIMVTGCASGDSESEYYDAPASECEVVVQHTPEGTEVSVLATLPSYDSTGAQVGETVATAQFIAVPLE